MSVLECRNLTKKYGNLTALDNIDLTLEPGRIVLYPATLIVTRERYILSEKKRNACRSF